MDDKKVLGDRLLYLGGGGRYQQKPSQKHITPLVETKNVMTPPVGHTKKW